jgi:hypothetical protein
VAHAYLAAGQFDKAAAHDHEEPPIVITLALDLMGHRDRAVAQAREQIVSGLPTQIRLFFELTVAGLEGRGRDAHVIADQLLAKWRLRDPCATFYLARTLALIEHPRALTLLRRAVDGGYHMHPFVTRDPWLDPLRGHAEFRHLVQMTEAGARDDAEAFIAAGGEKLLGPPSG